MVQLYCICAKVLQHVGSITKQRTGLGRYCEPLLFCCRYGNSGTSWLYNPCPTIWSFFVAFLAIPLDLQCSELVDIYADMHLRHPQPQLHLHPLPPPRQHPHPCLGQVRLPPPGRGPNPLSPSKHLSTLPPADRQCRLSLASHSNLLVSYCTLVYGTASLQLRGTVQHCADDVCFGGNHLTCLQRN